MNMDREQKGAMYAYLMSDDPGEVAAARDAINRDRSEGRAGSLFGRPAPAGIQQRLAAGQTPEAGRPQTLKDAVKARLEDGLLTPASAQPGQPLSERERRRQQLLDQRDEITGELMEMDEQDAQQDIRDSREAWSDADPDAGLLPVPLPDDEIAAAVEQYHQVHPETEYDPSNMSSAARDALNLVQGAARLLQGPGQ